MINIEEPKEAKKKNKTKTKEKKGSRNNEFRKVTAYNVKRQKSVTFLYTNNEPVETN